MQEEEGVLTLRNQPLVLAKKTSKVVVFILENPVICPIWEHGLKFGFQGANCHYNKPFKFFKILLITHLQFLN